MHLNGSLRIQALLATCTTSSHKGDSAATEVMITPTTRQPLPSWDQQPVIARHMPDCDDGLSPRRLQRGKRPAVSARPARQLTGANSTSVAWRSERRSASGDMLGGRACKSLPSRTPQNGIA